MSRAYWTRLAQADLVAVEDYYETRDPAFFLRLERCAMAAGRFLADYPRAGPEIALGTRKWSVPTTDYVMIYRIVGADIEVLRVYHAAQNWRSE